MEKETHTRLDCFSLPACLVPVLTLFITLAVHHPDHMRLFFLLNYYNCFTEVLMETFWYIPRVKQAASSRTSANPEASNMMGPLLLSGSAQTPRWFRLLLSATRRSVSAKPASLFRQKTKTNQCHFCGDKNGRKLCGSFREGGLNTEIRRLDGHF